MHIQLVEVLQQRAERRAFGHLGKGEVENGLYQDDEADEGEGGILEYLEGLVVSDWRHFRN